jgi:hypothetical protein
MPYTLPLSVGLKRARWKVKIHENERLEPPHITIYKKNRTWRYSLRDKEFLDNGDSWKQIDNGVKDVIQNRDNWECFKKEWNKMHPGNPV